MSYPNSGLSSKCYPSEYCLESSQGKNCTFARMGFSYVKNCIPDNASYGCNGVFQKSCYYPDCRQDPLNYTLGPVAGIYPPKLGPLQQPYTMPEPLGYFSTEVQQPRSPCCNVFN